MKVLIVEDDSAVSYFLEQVVTTAGHETRVCGDGRMALELFADFNPDLIISDLMLPELNGIEILEEVRRTKNDTIFVMMTGHGSEELAIRALELRANNYLHKPIRHEALLNLIQKYSELIRTRTMREEVKRMVTRRKMSITIDNRLEIVSDVVDFLGEEAAPFLSDTERVSIQLGLYELIINAIEHGNLGINYLEKNQALYESPQKLLELIRIRSEHGETAKKRVRIDFEYDGECLLWVITDEGDGFDWYSLPNPLSHENHENLNGRGIFLARFQFDELTFLGKGNRVRVIKRPGSEGNAALDEDAFSM